VIPEFKGSSNKIENILENKIIYEFWEDEFSDFPEIEKQTLKRLEWNEKMKLYFPESSIPQS
ncbi:MAG: hypothetical protein WC304_03150, partial [Candidatus Gracilibacteria bacterium]